MLNTVRAHIDLSALRHNLALVRSLCPASKVMAMVKADAYGHGLLRVAAALDGSDGFAVARLNEALQLRDAGFSQRILLLGTLLDAGDLSVCAERRIDVTVHDMAMVKLIADDNQRAPLRVWLKLDSGMHRLGLAPAEFIAADKLLRTVPAVEELLHLTHLSSAEDALAPATAQQLAVFASARNGSDAPTSIANSAGLIAQATSNSWVRPGIMLYGANPVAATHALPLRPAMTLTATVVALRRIGRGETVGYNGTWVSRRDSLIATIGIGYGDGYPRHAKNGTPVWINGQIAALAGRVSMDLITVDVTDCKRVAVGDEAQLWGADLPATRVAEFADTISYELFTSLSNRVPRIYVDRLASIDR